MSLSDQEVQVRVSVAPELASFREVSRGLLARGLPPERVSFEEARGPWEGRVDALLRGMAPGALPVVPRDFLGLAEKVVCHREPERWALLYRVLWRLTHGERRLLEREVDRDVQRLRRMERAVRRDVRSLVIRVRFRPAVSDGAERYVAWYRPEHLVVRLAAPFLVGRFPTLRWSLFTPDASAHWDLARLSYGAGLAWEAPPRTGGPTRSPGAPRFQAPPEERQAGAPVMMVGDVPDTREDGDVPGFAGAAGRLLEVVLSRAGLKPKDLHVSRGPWSGGDADAPGWREAQAFREALALEVASVRPLLMLALGPVAGQAVLGPGFRLHLNRGQFVQTPWARGAMATFAPSDVLRRTDPRERAELRIHFEADLRSAAQWLRLAGARG
ncbi:DUF4130 domain-containing protein [Myxococcus qinghaiensis]|uniref:DUF4130 domain-containing protein n=1 Tax=Myxococcus qinghaiensis TaxID=2906758 RepID=UPI0020A763B0|nr:DUF4130 domain-containing protein [Myxococcus qinghaiensis]MCP3164025.1 DUF4130 domain-containing protein [Myxococcus qinghaiensis]